MNIPPEKNIYFLSDFHLGAPDAMASRQREKRIVQFLESVRNTAAQIFIVGDMFDFWFEYKLVVPRGYTRLFGKLAELSDAGILIHFFVGNHDMWMRNYFETEFNIPVYYGPKQFEFNGKQFLIGHGDGQGPGDNGYKFLKKIFRNKICQWMFGVLPPYFGMGIANYFSRKSRELAGKKVEKFLGEDEEWLIIFCKETLKKQHFDFFIFGHRHLPIDFTLNENSRYINLGEWINYDSYAVFDGSNTSLKYFKNEG